VYDLLNMYDIILVDDYKYYNVIKLINKINLYLLKKSEINGKNMRK